MDIAEQTLFQIFVGVISERQQIIALDLALEKQRGARGGRRLAITARIRETLDFLLEAVALAGREEITQIEAAHIDRALDHTRRDHRTQIGQEADLLLRLEYAARNTQGVFTRFVRREQRKLGAAALDEHLYARLGFVDVLDFPAGKRRFER